jgi:ribosome maturation factor RimP
MEVTETVRTLCEPLADDLGIELYDVERAGGILRITVDQPGGIPLDLVAEATRRISRMLDEHDPVPGRYTLEVSSPGLERNLRTPAHYAWAVGRLASIRTRHADGEVRRFRGVVLAADDDGIDVRPEDGVETRRLTYAEIDKARTVFEWGPTPKPGGSRKERGGSGDNAGDDNEVDE